MTKRLLFVFTFVMLTVTAFAQWTNVGPWPGEQKGHLHGLVVDRDGKIWASDYYTNDSLANPGVAGGWQKVRTIQVFNPDGSQVSFSPIKMAVGNGISDTLKGATTGMALDHEGNIILTHGNPAKLYRFDYKTGAAMAKVDLSLAGKISTGGSAAVDANGNIYVKPVIPGNPVQIYDKDFAYLGNVYDASKGYARTSAVSADGLTFYDCGYTNNKIYVWHRDDEFTQFAITDSLEGFNTESVCWDPVDAGHLWVSAGNTGYDAPGLFGNYQLSSWAWYKIDLANKVLKDSLFWTLSTADNANEKQRAIGISADGKTAYVGCFGAPGMPFIQKLTKGGTAVEKLEGIATSYELAQNYPNPFNPSTTITFSIPEAGMVSIKVYDVLGKEVANLMNEEKASGIYSVSFDASQLPTGTYIYTISAGNYSSTKKMLLLK